MGDRYRLSERAEPGLEMSGGLGEWGHAGSVGDHEQQIGPALFGKVRGTDRALRYEAGLLFGLTDVTPATTVRFLLEYEFQEPVARYFAATVAAPVPLNLSAASSPWRA